MDDLGVPPFQETSKWMINESDPSHPCLSKVGKILYDLYWNSVFCGPTCVPLLPISLESFCAEM